MPNFIFWNSLFGVISSRYYFCNSRPFFIDRGGLNIQNISNVIFSWIEYHNLCSCHDYSCKVTTGACFGYFQLVGSLGLTPCINFWLHLEYDFAWNMCSFELCEPYGLPADSTSTETNNKIPDLVQDDGRLKIRVVASAFDQKVDRMTCSKNSFKYFRGIYTTFVAVSSLCILCIVTSL